MSKPAAIAVEKCSDCGVVEDLSDGYEIVHCEQCSAPVCTGCDRDIVVDPGYGQFPDEIKSVCHSCWNEWVVPTREDEY
jgi:hypothetical protein